MVIKTEECIKVERDTGSHDTYYPDEIIEVLYRIDKNTMYPRTVTGRFDSIRHSVTSFEKTLYLDVSDKYRTNIIKIPVDGIESIGRAKHEQENRISKV